MEKISAGKRLYEQVVERVRGMIEQGIYKKGDLLPSEKELMEMMGVSRITVREAMRLLSEAGVIHTIKGKGWKQIEGTTASHSRNITKEDLEEALRDLA